MLADEQKVPDALDQLPSYPDVEWRDQTEPEA